MEFHEEAFVLSARAHGDTGVVVDLLTETHGRYAAYVAGGGAAVANKAHSAHFHLKMRIATAM